jgi:2-iminobutanoate/2-iminopropanoate deaminase
MSAPPLRRAIHSARFPKPVASYSQGFQHGNTLYITGQLPVDPITNAVEGNGDITLESRQVMRNMQAVLEEAGFGFEHVVSATVYLTDINKLDTFDAVWQEYFPDPQAYPSRAVVQVAALVLGIQLEISAIAIKD